MYGDTSLLGNGFQLDPDISNLVYTISHYIFNNGFIVQLRVKPKNTAADTLEALI